MKDLFAKLYASLDKVVMIRMDNGHFEVVSTIPDWFAYHARRGGDNGVGYDLEENFPYLSCFMDEALAHWQEQQPDPLRSGPWIETDTRGQEMAFEATAMSIDGKNVLVLERLGNKFREEVSLLQRIRDGLLTQEVLESEVRQRTLQIRRREEEIALKLISLTSYRDEETGTHVRRIGLYAATIGRALNWDESRVDDIRVAAPMHDLGKIAIPDRILLKAGALNDDEFAVMKTHTTVGAKMLEGSGIPVLDMAAKIARHHHERWDGTGYPDGLSGRDIPIEARVTAVVDVYDALVHKRVYKSAMKEDEALAIMKDMAGKHLDPEILQIFLYLLPAMRRIRESVAEEDEHVTVVN